MTSRVRDDLKSLIMESDGEVDECWERYIQNAIDHIVQQEKDKTELRVELYEVRAKLYKLENPE